eukprot:scaffold115418_cov119-Cyclotella_meneghiniana.AAC.2
MMPGVLEAGRSKYGDNWRGSGGYGRANAFAKHFADHCRDCRTSDEVKSRIKEIPNPKIIWKGDRIRCMKSAMMPQCKLCMVERKEICHRLVRENKQSIINDNLDILEES